MKGLIIFVLVFFQQAHANMCEIASGKQNEQFLTVLVKEIPIPNTANYFVKVHPDKDILYFSGDEDKACIYDHSDPKNPRLTVVEGPYDPVPTPDGEFVTTPENGADGLRFYKVNSQGEGEVIGTDKEMKDNYQSTGLIPGPPKTYRLMNRGSRALFLKDYRVNENGKMKAITKKKEICKNIPDETGSSFDIPMISKSGKYVGVQYETSMKILRINDDGTCHVEHDLGVKTGKLEFDFEDSFAVFHSTELSPEGVFSQNIYRYDMKTKEISPLTDFSGTEKSDTPVFPAVKRNGNVVFRNVNSMFYEIESKKREGILLKGSFHCNDGSEKVIDGLALDYWKRICEKVTGVRGENINALTINIDEKSCDELKDKFSKVKITSKENYKDIDPKYLCQNVNVDIALDEAEELSEKIKAFKVADPKFFKLAKKNNSAIVNNSVPTSCKNCHTTVNWDSPVALSKQVVNSPLPESVFRSQRSRPCFPEQALARINAQEAVKGDRLIRMPAGERTSLSQHNHQGFKELVVYLKEAITYCEP